MIPWELGDGGREVGVGREKKSKGRREWGLANTGQNSRNYCACQCIFWISFEWSRKPLKRLQVASLKVEIQGRGSGLGKRKIQKRAWGGIPRNSQNPPMPHHPLQKPPPSAP